MNKFKKDLQQKAPLIGTWLMTNSEIVAEAISQLDFDFFVIDGEHAPIDSVDMARIDRAIKSVSNINRIYRVTSNEEFLIKRALDGGAQCVMVPFINSVDDAKKAIESAYYPPLGKRGFVTIQRGWEYKYEPDFVEKSFEDTFLILQIETLEAIENIEAIAKLEGVDALFIGPADMSASINLHAQLDNPKVEKLLKDSIKKCRQAGLPCGIIAGDSDTAKQYMSWGANWVAIGCDIGFLIDSASNQVHKYRCSKEVKKSGVY